MRTAILVATALLGFGAAHAQTAHPVPPGVREGEQKINNQQTDPPLVAQPRAADPAKLQSEAAELKGLADSIPPAVDQLAKGLMPKDLDANLKKIEKLAKHLRSQVGS